MITLSGFATKDVSESHLGPLIFYTSQKSHRVPIKDLDMSFSNIVVIESLRPDDRKTGHELYQSTLADIAQVVYGLNIDYANPQSSSELLVTIQSLTDKAQDTREGLILHIECHGDESGIQTSNDDILDWSELKEPLVALNNATNFNLMIVVAACSGAYLIYSAVELDRAPFAALIGPDNPAYDSDIRRDYDAFYRQYFVNLNPTQALAALNENVPCLERRHHLHSAVELFVKGYRRYHEQQLTGVGFEKRIERLTDESMKSIGNIGKDRSKIREAFRHQLLEKAPVIFFSVWQNYFNVLEEPCNAERFFLEYDKVVGEDVQ